jgi:BTB/POZ domain-containing protein KCTD9
MSDNDLISDAGSVEKPVSLADERVTLLIGEQRFTTTKSTLMSESGFFRALVTRWQGSADEDGSFFIDASAEMFQHILDYLRRKTFPLFFDKINGFNHGLYLRLLQEARFYQVNELADWIERKGYEELVTITTNCRMVQKDIPSATENISMYSHSAPAFSSVQLLPIGTTRKVYICPRAIPVHRDKPEACGRSCHNARPADGDVYEDQTILRTL